MIGILLASAAFAGSSNVSDGVAVGAATLGGQLAMGIGGGVAGVAIGTSMCHDSGHGCMAPLMAIPLAGLGAVIGAPIGAGIGAHATNRNPWRTVGFVGATQLGAVALTAGGLALMSGGSEAVNSVGVGMAVVGGVGGFLLPPVMAGVGAATGPDQYRFALLPDLGKDKVGVRLVASF